MDLDPLVNARSGANVARRGEILVSCRLCLKTFKPKSRLNRFCSTRYRLLFWAAGEIVREYLAGEAPGIRVFIERLKAC